MGEEFELLLTAMAHGGSALGKHNGRTVFVPYTIPGERALVRVTGEKGSVLFAEGVRLLEASADRVSPLCPHAGRGCCATWQHINYPAQLLLKQDVLSDQLARLGGLSDAEVEAAVQPVLPAPTLWNYAHHVTFEVDANTEVGFTRVDGRLLAVQECHVLHPALLALWESLELSDFGALQQLRLQIGSDGAPMVILTIENDEAPELETDLPASVNMLLDGEEPVNLIGDSHSRYVVRGQTFRATAGSSFRANVAQLDTLLDAVLRALDPQAGQALLDLYAGVGWMSAFIAPRAALVTVVDNYPPAMTDAEENLRAFDNVDVVEGDVEEVLEALEERYDAALLDPPPFGLSVQAADALGALGLPKLVYVSGDPATLARDTKRLARHGYRLTHAQPLDLAPQTHAIDTVATFLRE